MHSGVQHMFLFGKESTWGSGGTVSYDAGIVTDVTPNFSRETIIAQGIGDIEPHSNNAGIEEAGFTITLQYQHARFFEFILGEASHAQSGSDWSHTFTTPDDSPKSLACETGVNLSSGDVGFTLLGQMVESGELSIENNGLLMLSVTCRGRAPQAVDSSVAAHSTSTLPVFPAKLCTVSLNGTAADFVQSFRVSFRKTLNPTDGIGTVHHMGMNASDLRIEFSGTLAFDDTTFHTHFVSDNITAVTLDATNGTAFGSGKRAMELDLDEVVLNSFRVTARVGQLTFVELSGIAKLNTLVGFDNIASTSWFT